MDMTAFANASRELLQGGDPVGAEQVLAPVLNDLRADPSVTHLMGLIMKAQNRLEDAERYFRSAVANALQDGQYYNDLAVVLQARGNHGEAAKVFRAAIALLPQVGLVRVNLVSCLMATGDLAEAEREARAYLALSNSSEAWALLSTVQRALDRREDSLGSAEAAVRLAPNDRALRHAHAVALDRAGHIEGAVHAYRTLAQQGLDTAELALNFARALYAIGRHAEAESVLDQTVAHWPSAGAAHAALARMRWLRGEGEKCTRAIEEELQRRPDDASLYLVCADALHRGHHEAKALRILEQALTRVSPTPGLLTAMGIVLDELDRPEEGLAHLRRVAALTGNAANARRNLLSTLLRAGRPDEALHVARSLRANDPEEQYLLAVEATALRMLGGEGYRALYDYGAFVRTFEIPAPRGFFTVDNFNASLTDWLRIQHHKWAHPLDQTLENGTQTGRSLLSFDEPNIKAFLSAVDGAVRTYLSDLPEIPGHPFTQRKRRDFYRFSGCWSVRLRKGGFQPNHVHDRGWISSAYFPALPASMGEDKAGWLKFGEPNRAIAGCGADHYVQPKKGLLVLFPSYMWHGTLPFSEGEERLSVAFDVVPA
ncbi:MAG: putative 2OG-Fe(II) oxygenase [Hyphomonadaceae bacterium]